MKVVYESNEERLRKKILKAVLSMKGKYDFNKPTIIRNVAVTLCSSIIKDTASDNDKEKLSNAIETALSDSLAPYSNKSLNDKTISKMFAKELAYDIIELYKERR